MNNDDNDINKNVEDDFLIDIRRPSPSIPQKAHDTPEKAKSPDSNIAHRATQVNQPPKTADVPPRKAPSRGLSDNLRSQTPLNRTLRKQKKPVEPGTVRRDNAPQHFKVNSDLNRKQTKRKNKRNPSILTFMLVCGFIMYAVIMPVIILSIKFALPRHSTGQTGDYIYQLGPDNNVYSTKIYDYTRVKLGNEYYVNMDTLADYCTLTTTGDNEAVRYVVRSSGDYVEFIIGQSIAYINGVQERTGGIIQLKNDTVYVPASFASRCFIGINITIDEMNNKITIVRSQNENGEYVDLSFPYKLPKQSNRINFADLDSDIQEIIIMQNQPKQPEDIPEQPIQ